MNNTQLESKRQPKKNVKDWGTRDRERRKMRKEQGKGTERKWKDECRMIEVALCTLKERENM